MKDKTTVIAYAGYKSEETPRAFFIHGETINVDKIFERWVEERINDRGRKRFFRVKGSDGNIYVICYDEKSMEW